MPATAPSDACTTRAKKKSTAPLRTSHPESPSAARGRQDPRPHTTDIPTYPASRSHRGCINAPSPNSAHAFAALVAAAEADHPPASSRPHNGNTVSTTAAPHTPADSRASAPGKAPQGLLARSKDPPRPCAPQKSPQNLRPTAVRFLSHLQTISAESPAFPPLQLSIDKAAPPSSPAAWDSQHRLRHR